MINIISAFSKRGNKYNEDSFIYSDNSFVVVDGATGLNGIKLTSSETDAAWLAKRICDLLRKDLMDSSNSINKILKKEANIIKSELDNLGYKQFKHSNIYPSACVSIVRINGKNLECYTLGDSPILILKKNNELISLYDNSVEKMDKKVLSQMINLRRRTGCDISYARQYQSINNMLIENRLKMNTKKSYYIFEPTGQGIDHIKKTIIPLSEILAFTLMTDGFYSVLSTYNIVKTNEDLMLRLLEGNALQLFNNIKFLSSSDITFNKYPRFKPIDDATVIVAKNIN